MEDRQYKADAKTITDVAFESGMFKESVTRDNMNEYEDLIAFMLKSRLESYLKAKSLLDRLKEREEKSGSAH